jgi:hypothetical protein
MGGNFRQSEHHSGLSGEGGAHSSGRAGRVGTGAYVRGFLLLWW